jgi:hypothetical protein
LHAAIADRVAPHAGAADSITQAQVLAGAAQCLCVTGLQPGQRFDRGVQRGGKCRLDLGLIALDSRFDGRVFRRQRAGFDGDFIRAFSDGATAGNQSCKESE